MQCSKGHEITGKFCGECGEAAPAQLAKATCGSCKLEQDGAHKHCAECGTSLVKASADLKGVLETLGSFAKARQELGDDITVTPGTHDADALLQDEQAEDAIPFLKAFIGQANSNADLLKALAGEVRVLRKEDSVLAKAIAAGLGAIGSQLAEFGERLEAIENAPGRPKSILPGGRQVTPITKANAGSTGGNQDEDTSLRGNDLVKAAIAAEQAGKLGDGDATLIQFWANRGATLNVLAKAAPEAHQRLVATLPKEQGH